jgi:hypothetical protein
MIKEKSLDIIFIAILIFIGSFIIWINTPFSIETIESNFIVAQNTGFDLTPGYMNFGSIVTNNSAERKLTITNNFNKKIKVKINPKENLKENLVISNQSFELNPLESKKIIFTLFTTNLPKGNYSGQIEIISKRVLW